MSQRYLVAREHFNETRYRAGDHPTRRISAMTSTPTASPRPTGRPGLPPTQPHADHDHPAVGPEHRDLIAQVLDTWSLQVLAELCDRPSRFNELRRAIPAVTQKSLTATLRRLERNGVVAREVLGTRPVAVQYSITPLGKTFREPIDALLAWTTEHLPEIEQARERYDDAVD